MMRTRTPTARVVTPPLVTAIAIATATATATVAAAGGGDDARANAPRLAGGTPCEVPCPTGAIPEDERCGPGTPDINSGCSDSSYNFTPVVCGETICGNAWAIGGTRDTDWYELGPPGFSGDDLVHTTLVAGFDAFYLYAGDDPSCVEVPFLGFVNSDGCGDAATMTHATPSTSTTRWFIAKSNFDLLPCESSGISTNDYVVHWTCEDIVPPPPCPQLGDTNQDGTVDFTDVLAVLSNFGPCP